MIEIPFYNDFYSTVRPENKNEIIEHCMNPSLELPRMDFQWGEECDKVSLKLTGFTEDFTKFFWSCKYIYNWWSMEEYLSSILSSGTTYDHQGYELSFVIFMNDFHGDDASFILWMKNSSYLQIGQICVMECQRI